MHHLSYSVQRYMYKLIIRRNENIVIRTGILEIKREELNTTRVQFINF